MSLAMSHGSGLNTKQSAIGLRLSFIPFLNDCSGLTYRIYIVIEILFHQRVKAEHFE